MRAGFKGSVRAGRRRGVDRDRRVRDPRTWSIGAWLTDPKSLAQLGQKTGCSGALEVVNGFLGDGVTKLGGSGAPGAVLRHVLQTMTGQACQLTTPISFKDAANLFVKATLKKIAESASKFVQSSSRTWPTSW